MKDEVQASKKTYSMQMLMRRDGDSVSLSTEWIGSDEGGVIVDKLADDSYTLRFITKATEADKKRAQPRFRSRKTKDGEFVVTDVIISEKGANSLLLALSGKVCDGDTWSLAS